MLEALRQLSRLAADRIRAGLGDLGVLAAIALCLVTSAGFGLSALYGLLRAAVGPVGASGLLALGLLVIALSLALWWSLLRGFLRHDPSTIASPLVAGAGLTTGGITAGGAAAAAQQTDPLHATLAQPDPAHPMQAADLMSSTAFLAGFLLARRL